MPAGSLEGRVALVTGAAQRIGREIALALAKQKADVVVHYHRSVKDAEELRKELAGYGVKAWLIGADFNKRSEYEALISKAQAAAGHLDILVNSASIFPLKKLESLDFDDLVQNIQVNAWAPFVLCRDFARQTKEGQIVNLLDS